MSKPSLDDWKALCERQDQRLTEVYAALDEAIAYIESVDVHDDGLAARLRKVRTVRA